MLDPSRAYYQRQIEGATGLSIRAVQRDLERLAETGLLYRRPEGNRAYYQIDAQFPLFEELRRMVLKTSRPVDRLRGTLAADDDVRLAFLDGEARDVLVVTASSRRLSYTLPDGFRAEVMPSEEFVRAVGSRSSGLDRFLKTGVDILGRRDDVIWRRIEAAGYAVKKLEGLA